MVHSILYTIISSLHTAMVATSKSLNSLYERTSRHLYGIAVAALCLFTIVIVLFHLVTLTRTPPIFIDESWYANTAWNWLTTGRNADTINAGTPVSLHWPYIGNLPLVVSFALFDLGLFQARLVSWVFGIVLLLITFFVSRQSYDTLCGLLAVLFLALSFPFSQASHYARPDIFLTAVGMLCFFLVQYAIKKNQRWAHLAAGILIGLSFDIHQNGLLYAIGLGAVYIYVFGKQVLRQPGTWLFVAGGGIGIIYYIVVSMLPGMGEVLGYYQFSFANSHPIPVVSLNPVNLIKSARDEIGRYHFFENTLDFVLIGASIVYFAVRRSKADIVFLVFVGSVFTSFVLLVGNKHDIYAILLYPYFMIMVAETLVSIIRSAKGKGPAYAFALMLLALTILSSSYHLVRSSLRSQRYNYYSITEQIKQVIPQDARVVGLPHWWLGMADYDYKSILGLSYYNIYNGYSLTEGLEAMYPDFIIVDTGLRGLLVDQGYFRSNSGFDLYKMPRSEFENFLLHRGEKIYEFHDNWHGRFEIYSIHWDR